jgi:hypothetical protein
MARPGSNVLWRLRHNTALMQRDIVIWLLKGVYITALAKKRVFSSLVGA